MQDEARERDRLRAEREGIQHRLAALDDPSSIGAQETDGERQSLAARLAEIDTELDRLNEWFDRLQPDERPT
jgi:hypothetical protein